MEKCFATDRGSFRRGAARRGATVKKKKEKRERRKSEKDAKNGARRTDRKPRAAWRVFLFVFSSFALFFYSLFYLFPPFVHLIGIRAVRSLSLPEFQRFLISFSESLLEEESIFL